MVVPRHRRQAVHLDESEKDVGEGEKRQEGEGMTFAAVMATAVAASWLVVDLGLEQHRRSSRCSEKHFQAHLLQRRQGRRQERMDS